MRKTAIERIWGNTPQATEALRSTARAHRDAVLSAAKARQGDSALDMPRSHAAFHEAGHVCVHVATDFSVTKVEVIDLGFGRFGGETTCDKPVFSVQSAIDFLPWAARLLSGVIAERNFAPPPFHAGSSADEIGAARALLEVAAGGCGHDAKSLEHLVETRTVDLLRAHHDELSEIAGLLMTRRYLRAKHLDPILARVTPLTFAELPV